MRRKYQSTVELLLAEDSSSDPGLQEFQMRNSQGLHLCRFSGCDRTEQGFDTSNMRDEHEVNHAPKLKCSNWSCGMSGQTFKSRAQLRKHELRYHEPSLDTSFIEAAQKFQGLEPNESSSPVRESGDLLSKTEDILNSGGRSDSPGNFTQENTGTSPEMAQIIQLIGNQQVPTGWQQTFRVDWRAHNAHQM